jgi:hypothetical protein
LIEAFPLLSGNETTDFSERAFRRGGLAQQEERLREVAPDPFGNLDAGWPVTKANIGDDDVGYAAVIGQNGFESCHRLGGIHQCARTEEQAPQALEEDFQNSDKAAQLRDLYRGS